MKPIKHVTYQNEDEFIDDGENQLLDQLEKSTRRLHLQSQFMQDETSSQMRLIDSIDGSLQNGSDELLRQARNIHRTKRSNEGDCWLYTVIALEIAILFLLLIVGLS